MAVAPLLHSGPGAATGVDHLSYDRRVAGPLLAALREGEWASSLVEYGRGGQYSLDLQLRGYAGRPNCWATLYVGLTKVLDLHYHASRGFRLDVHPTWKVHGWDPAWESPVVGRFKAVTWQSVEAYLERVIPKVGRRFLNEGAVQSAISAFRSRSLAVIDREVAISFPSQAAKTRVSNRLAQPLLDALEPEGKEAWWRARPTHLGGECDALAVGKDGSLLAIEIKPATAAGTIPWAPVQVRHYANLIQEWASNCPDAASILNGMIDQRVELGLIASETPHVTLPINVRPVLAIARGASQTVLDRLRAIDKRLIDAGLSDPPLKICTVNLVGRLDPLDPRAGPSAPAHA